MSDKDFDKVFQEQLGDLSSTPSELNWVGIESQLPPSSAGQSRKLWWVAAALVLLLGSSTAYWVLNSNAENTSIHPLVSHSFDLSFDALTVSRLLAQQPATTTAPTVIYVDRANDNASLSNANNNVAASQSSSVSDVQASGFEGSLSSLKRSGIRQLDNDAVMVLNPVFYNEKEELQRHAVSGFRVGPLVQAQFSQHTNGTLPVDNASLSPMAGIAYGMAFHYDFNEKWGLEVDAIISSTEGVGVRFDELAFAPTMEQQNFKATSNYLRFPVMLKYRQPVARSTNGNPSVWNYQIGLQYGRVNWVNLDDAASLFMPEQFNTHELGYLVGISRDWYLGKNYLFTMGARGGLSHSVTQGTNQPITWQLGLHAQLNLLLPKKAK